MLESSFHIPSIIIHYIPTNPNFRPEGKRKFIRILHISHPITPRFPSISYTLPSPNKVSPLLIIIHPIVVSIKRVPLKMRFELVKIKILILLLKMVYIWKNIF